MPGFGTIFEDRPSPFDLFDKVAHELVDFASLANGNEISSKVETFAKIRVMAILR